MSDGIRAKPFTGGPALPAAPAGEQGGVKQVPAKSSNANLNVKAQLQGAAAPSKPAGDPAAVTKPLSQLNARIPAGAQVAKVRAARLQSLRDASLSGSSSVKPQFGRGQPVTSRPISKASESVAQRDQWIDDAMKSGLKDGHKGEYDMGYMSAKALCHLACKQADEAGYFAGTMRPEDIKTAVRAALDRFPEYAKPAD